MTAAVEVSRARPQDRARLVEVLSRSFTSDPVIGWLLGGERPSTPRQRARFFRLTVPESVVAAGSCDLAPGGAAVWYRPGAFAAAQDQSLRGLFAAVGAFRSRLAVAARADAEMRRHHPSEPHWYLQFIGVEPDLVGRGVGSALLAHRLAEIDAAGDSAYLESSSERNLPLYRRHGFEVVEEIRLGPGAPLEWLMRRQ